MSAIRSIRARILAALLLGFLVALPLAVRAQGVASRGVRPAPQGEPSGRPFHARFVDVAADAGLTMPTIYGETEGNDYILETVGAGAAWFDYDDDGWIDLLLLSGTRLNKPPPHAVNRLYRNLGDGTFEDVTRGSGLGRSGWASSVTVGDIDNDGRDDLFITYWGRNVLFRNRGDGVFADVTDESGLGADERRWGSGATFLDYDRDGRLDLFVANYLDFDLETVPRKGADESCRWKGVPVNCGPRGLPEGRHSLYHNQGDGTFADVSEQSGIADSRPGYGMTAVAADLDDDGWVDIYLACDGTPSLFFRNNGDGTFSEEGLLRGIALSEDGMEQAGMGVALGDYNLDGELDLFKTHFSDDTNVLYHNEGDGIFRDVTIQAGLAVETRFVGWGAALVDLDNDGLPDIFYTTGSVYTEVERSIPGHAYRTPSVIFRNLGDRFEELIAEGGPGVSSAHSSRGAAFGDYDNDGDVDVLIVNLNEPPTLLRNDLRGDAGWLKVELRAKSNRSVLGAQVIARYGDHRQKRVVLAQSSFYSVDDPRLHFGLGDAERADLEILWPDGSVETIENLTANQWVTIEQGEGVTGMGKP